MLMLLACSSSAFAATYNLILKSGGGVIEACATGGFTFTKTAAGTFPASGSSVVLNGSQALPCFGVEQNRTLSTGSLSVTVANVTQNGEDQGPNVVSVAGSLSSGNGQNHYTITFAADKSFVVTRNTGQNPQVGSGVYHVYNTANTVPEPESLWLTLAGLSALVLSRRRRRG